MSQKQYMRDYLEAIRQHTDAFKLSVSVSSGYFCWLGKGYITSRRTLNNNKPGNISESSTRFIS